MAKTIDGVISEYYESSYKGDISGIFKKTGSTGGHYRFYKRNIYSPYGMVWCNNTTIKAVVSANPTWDLMVNGLILRRSGNF